MNILLCSIQEVERECNGVACHIKDLRLSLSEKGHHVTLVTPYQGGKASPWWRRARVLVQKLYDKTHFSLWYYLRLVLLRGQLRSQIKSLAKDYDVVQSNDLISAQAALQATDGQLPNVLVCHFWAWPWEEFSRAGYLKQEGLFYRRLKKSFMASLKDPRLQLVSVSQWSQKLVKSLWPHQADENQSKTPRVIHLGVRPPKGLRPSLNGLSNKEYIINVGKLEIRKNQRMILEVARIFQEQNLPYVFVMVGPEESEEKDYFLDKINYFGLETRIFLLGPKDRESVFALMKGAKLYLHTSLQESFGMVLLEAISVDTPVMALEYEALHEIFPGVSEAIIDKAARPEEVAKKLKYFLEKPAAINHLRDMEKSSYLQEFTLEAMASHYEKFYAEILQPPWVAPTQKKLETEKKRVQF